MAIGSQGTINVQVVTAPIDAASISAAAAVGITQTSISAMQSVVAYNDGRGLAVVTTDSTLG